MSCEYVIITELENHTSTWKAHMYVVSHNVLPMEFTLHKQRMDTLEGCHLLIEWIYWILLVIFIFF